MKNIIVVGYPKSGSTWITRLTAELVGCPITGFWNQSNQNEIACEGQDRTSDFKCFKSHHQLHELGIDINSDEHYIIYVVRDPRDIAISGVRFFEFKKYKHITTLLNRIPKRIDLFRKILKKILNRILHSERYRIDKMINAIIYGSIDVHYWCRIPWKSHYEPYLDNGVLFIVYEDMLTSAERECSRILDYLNLNRDAAFINNAIKKQSFYEKRNEFIRKGEKVKARFMRVGKSGQWKQKLFKEQKDNFIKCLSKELKFFSYET